MPDLSVSDNSDTKDDDDIPDLVPFEDEVVDDVLMDAGNMHGGILFHDTRRSVDGGIQHCEHNVRYSQLSTHEAERELRQDNEVTFR